MSARSSSSPLAPPTARGCSPLTCFGLPSRRRPSHPETDEEHTRDPDDHHAEPDPRAEHQVDGPVGDRVGDLAEHLQRPREVGGQREQRERGAAHARRQPPPAVGEPRVDPAEHGQRDGQCTPGDVVHDSTFAQPTYEATHASFRIKSKHPRTRLRHNRATVAAVHLGAAAAIPKFFWRGNNGRVNERLLQGSEYPDDTGEASPLLATALLGTPPTRRAMPTCSLPWARPACWCRWSPSSARSRSTPTASPTTSPATWPRCCSPARTAARRCSPSPAPRRWPRGTRTPGRCRSRAHRGAVRRSRKGPTRWWSTSPARSRVAVEGEDLSALAAGWRLARSANGSVGLAATWIRARRRNVRVASSVDRSVRTSPDVIADLQAETRQHTSPTRIDRPAPQVVGSGPKAPAVARDGARGEVSRLASAWTEREPFLDFSRPRWGGLPAHRTTLEDTSAPSFVSTSGSGYPRSDSSDPTARPSASSRPTRPSSWPRRPTSTSSRSLRWQARPSASSWTTGSSSTRTPRRPVRRDGTRPT